MQLDLPTILQRIWDRLRYGSIFDFFKVYMNCPWQGILCISIIHLVPLLPRLPASGENVSTFVFSNEWLAAVYICNVGEIPYQLHHVMSGILRSLTALDFNLQPSGKLDEDFHYRNWLGRKMKLFAPLWCKYWFHINCHKGFFATTKFYSLNCSFNPNILLKRKEFLLLTNLL